MKYNASNIFTWNFWWPMIAVLAWIQMGCQPKTESSESTLARVGSEIITESRYRVWWNERRPVEDTPEARQALLEKVIERFALVQAAREAKLDQDPAVVEQIENLLIGRLRETQWQPQLEALRVSEEELRSAYEGDDTLLVPARVRVAVLWFDTRGQAPLVARYTPRLEAARAAAESLPASDGFGSVAQANTEHRPSRFKGGDLGWLQEESTPDPWKSQILALAKTLPFPGDCSQVLAADNGLFLVRLMERQAAVKKPFVEVREGLERRLLSHRRQALEKEFLQTILARFSVHQFPERLNAMQDLPVSEPTSMVGGVLQLGSH